MYEVERWWRKRRGRGKRNGGEGGGRGDWGALCWMERDRKKGEEGERKEVERKNDKGSVRIGKLKGIERSRGIGEGRRQSDRGETAEEREREKTSGDKKATKGAGGK